MSEITDTIIQQLGGLGMLRAMLGVTHIVRGDRCIQFKMEGCKKINQVSIEYIESADAYRVKFFHYSAATLDLKRISDYDDIYCDQLVNLIEEETQWLLSLSKREN